MKKRIKIKDIAERLGISTSTVSRSLNPSSSAKISDEVVAKVKKMADELGYFFDQPASALRKQKTGVIGVLIPDLLNPIFAEIIKGAQTYLEEKQFVTLIASTNNTISTAKEEVKKLLSRRVEGLIIASAFWEDASINYCLEQQIPMVLAGRAIQKRHLVHQVMNDEHYGIKLAIDYLYSQGHKKIIHFAGPNHISQGKERLTSFLDQCESRNIDCGVIQLSEFSIEAGKEGADLYMQAHEDKTAILAANDMIAIGAIQRLQNEGIKVPNQVSVIGFNGMFMSDMVSPPLTTIAVPFQYLGEQAARLLLQVINHTGQPTQKIVIAPELIIRKSVQRISS